VLTKLWQLKNENIMCKKITLKVSFIVFLLFTFASQVNAIVSLNGVATHSELGKELFIAGLYTSTPSSSMRDILIANEEKQIQVRVTADRLSSRRFKRMWIEGMAVNASPKELKEQSGNMAIFSNLLKIKMTKGDIFSVDRYHTNIGDSVESAVRISINGATLGEISDVKFFDLLLRTWLGPVPLSSDFRADLLKSGDVDAGLLASYESTTPSEERIAIVAEAAQTLISSRSTPGNRVVGNSPALNPPSVSPPAPSQSQVDNTSQSDPEPAPEIAIAPPAPQLVPTPSPSPSPKPEPEEEVKPETIEVAKVEPQAQPAPSEIFEDEEEEGEFTAESVLSQQLYVSSLKKYSNKYLKYPSVALKRGYEGNVRLIVVIDRNGKVINYETLEKSKHNSLNKAATRAVRKADPFPPVPKEVSGDTFTFSLPIAFRMAPEK